MMTLSLQVECTVQRKGALQKEESLRATKTNVIELILF